MPSNLRRRLIRTSIVAIIAAVIFGYIIKPVQLGESSFTHLQELLGMTFVNRLSYVFSGPEPGDIVAIRTSGMSVIYIRRILAPPNSTIMVLSGSTFVNQEPLRDPSFDGTLPHHMREQRLDKDEYFVVGTEAQINGSRQFGRVQKNRIIGKVLF